MFVDGILRKLNMVYWLFPLFEGEGLWGFILFLLDGKTCIFLGSNKIVVTEKFIVKFIGHDGLGIR